MPLDPDEYQRETRVRITNLVVAEFVTVALLYAGIAVLGTRVTRGATREVSSA